MTRTNLFLSLSISQVLEFTFDVLIPNKFLFSFVGVVPHPSLPEPPNILLSILPHALIKASLALLWLSPCSFTPPVLSLSELEAEKLPPLPVESNTDWVLISTLFFLLSSFELPLTKSVLLAVLTSSESSSTRGMKRFALSLNFASSSSFALSCFFSP